MMNPGDMLERNWKTRQVVTITSHFQGDVRSSGNWLVIPYDIPSGNLASYFPEANELIPLNSTADISNTPTSKWIICSLSETIDSNEEE